MLLCRGPLEWHQLDPKGQKSNKIWRCGCYWYFKHNGWMKTACYHVFGILHEIKFYCGGTSKTPSVPWPHSENQTNAGEWLPVWDFLHLFLLSQMSLFTPMFERNLNKPSSHTVFISFLSQIPSEHSKGQHIPSNMTLNHPSEFTEALLPRIG